MTDREVMQMALEALQADEHDMVPDKEGHMIFRKDAAITALRERLERPQPATPDWIHYEPWTDVLTIHGRRYSASMFGEAGFLAPTGTVLRIEDGPEDVVTVSTVEQPDEIRDASNNLAPWLSAALEDPQACAEFKQAVEWWFQSGVVDKEHWPELEQPQQEPQQYTYASTQATMCAGCGKHKHTPLRIDAMGGYVCLTCIDQKLGSLLGEFGYPEPEQPTQPDQEPVACANCWGTGSDVAGKPCPFGCKPSNTTPPRREWVGLTDAEIRAVVSEVVVTPMYTHRVVARAIEAKLKEKNA